VVLLTVLVFWESLDVLGTLVMFVLVDVFALLVNSVFMSVPFVVVLMLAEVVEVVEELVVFVLVVIAVVVLLMFELVVLLLATALVM